MGGTKSKAIVDSITEQISNLSMASVQNCVVNTGQYQQVNASNAGWQIGGTTRIVQTTTVNSKCFQDANLQASLQNQIFQAIKNTTDAQGVGILGAVGASNAAAATNLRNKITNNVTLRNIQNNYNAIMQQQTANVSNAASGVQIFHDTDITQGASVFANAVLNVVQSAGILNDVKAQVDQAAAAKTENPLSFIGDIVGNIADAISSSFIMIAGIVICVLGALAYLVLGGASSAVSSAEPSASQETPSEAPQEMPAATVKQ